MTDHQITANEVDPGDLQPPANAEAVDAKDIDNSTSTDLTATAKFRHLQQITVEKAVKELPAADARRIRLRYRFDTFMAKGGGSIFKALTATFVITFLLIGLLRGALLLLFPEVGQQHEDLGFLGNVYITFLEITDPGNMALDM